MPPLIEAKGGVVKEFFAIEKHVSERE